MKKKVGTFKIWLLAIAAVVAFSVLPKVSSLATEDQALVVKENKLEAADAAGDESSAENKQETAGEGANLEAQGLEIPYMETLLPLMKNKYKTIKAKNDYERSMKLIRFALGRGYSMEVIHKCIDRMKEEDLGDIDFEEEF